MTHPPTPAIVYLSAPSVLSVCLSVRLPALLPRLWPGSPNVSCVQSYVDDYGRSPVEVAYTYIYLS